MIVAIIILSVLVVVLGFTTYNLLRKIEKQEDLINQQQGILASYLQYLDKISRAIEVSDEKLRQIDARGTFSSDDEVGFFFQFIKGLQDILNEFQLKKL
jgi:type II secretory pathway pseudopilin PulG